MTHICVNNLTNIGSVNGLSPGRRQAITWINAGILLVVPLGTNFSEISIEIPTFSFKKMRLKVSSAKWRPFCLSLNVLITQQIEFWMQWTSMIWMREISFNRGYYHYITMLVTDSARRMLRSNSISTMCVKQCPNFIIDIISVYM